MHIIKFLKNRPSTQLQGLALPDSETDGKGLLPLGMLLELTDSAKGKDVLDEILRTACN